MADRQLDLWMNERWYTALEKHFGGEDALRQKLEDMLDNFINVLPDHVCAQISREIQEDQQREKELSETLRRFAVFQITERGSTDYVLSELSLDTLNAAGMLRQYLRNECQQTDRFLQAIAQRSEITPAEFDVYVSERLSKSERVTGAFKIDLDKEIFSTLNISDGWHTYQTKDVSIAAYNAMRKTFEDWKIRQDILAEHLDGKEITPEHRLNVSRLSFADELMVIAGRLNFYVATDFDPDHAFGTNVCTDENDDWLNVYANYDMAKGQVCDALEINLCRGDGTEKTMLYPLSSIEMKVLTQEMDAFCQEQTGQSLKDYCAQLQAEDMAPSAGQTMG